MVNTYDKNVNLVLTSTVLPLGTVVTTYTWKINNVNQNSNTPNLEINTTTNLNEGSNTVSLVVICEHGTVSNEYISNINVEIPIPPVPQGENLILNPSFENGITTPLNWNFITANGNTPTWDNTVSHTGTKSVKISIPGTTNVVSGYPESNKVQVLPNTTYIVSVWGKTENIGGSNTPAARVVEFDVDNKFLKQTNILPIFNKGTNNWQQRTLEFTTTTSTKYVNIYANIWNGYGNFWLDDVSLTSKEIIPTTPTLKILANPIIVVSGTPIDVTFNVTRTDTNVAIDGVIVTLTGTSQGTGTTNISGIATISVNATLAGSITATASKTGFNNGTSTITSTQPQTPTLKVVSNPTTLIKDTPTDVVFTVTRTDTNIPVEGVIVTLSGVPTITGTTLADGTVAMNINATSAGTINTTAVKTGFNSGTSTITVTEPSSTSNPVKIKVDKTIVITVTDTVTSLPIQNISIESNGETKVTDIQGKVIFN